MSKGHIYFIVLIYMPTLSDNKQQFVINADSIFLNNNNDAHNSHIIVETKGGVNENDVEFKTCNVKIVDGDLSTKKIKDLAGNSIMTINTNAIDFNNVSISNLNLGSGSISATTVSSANGYASLDLELDAHLALINGKVSQNGHTANKIFVSSNGGALTTTGNCLPSDLSKLASSGAVDVNTAKVSFPGFGLTGTTALAGDTTTISVSQASSITANTAKISFPGFGTTAGTALEGDTTTISGSQASAITANTAKTSFPGFGTTAGFALEGDTTTISSFQSSAITANTAKTSFPGFGTTAGTSLEGNTTTISGSQASAITANTAKTSFPGFGTTAGTALEGDTTTISGSQASAITANTAKTSFPGFGTTAGTALQGNTTTISGSQASAISSNSSQTNLNSQAITLNSQNITNLGNLISSNDADIATNVTNISANTTKTSLFTKSGNQLGINISPNSGIDLQVHNPSTGSLVSTFLQLTNSNCASSGASAASGLLLYTTNPNTSFGASCGILNYEVNNKFILSSPLNSGTPSISLETNGDIKLDGDGDVFVEGGQFLIENSSDSDHQLIISRPSASYARIQTIEQGVGYNQVLSLQANNGRVAVGGTTAAAGLHVSKSVNLFPSNVGYLNTAGANGGWTPTGGYNIAIKTNNGGIWSDGFNIIVSSDRRIKENIVDVSDNKALNMLRDISCCWYNYKDRVEKGNERALGFIAQQVKEHLPEAVSIQKNIIPDEMKKIQTSWNETKMYSNDLQDVSGIKYRFYVSNDISDNEKMVELVGDENNCFTFEEKWENVFCYGKEVDDFHTLDKQKLFALNFSATQELDKKVSELLKRIEVLENK